VGICIPRRRPGAEFAQAVAYQKIIGGRIWPAWLTKVRVAVARRKKWLSLKRLLTRSWDNFRACRVFLHETQKPCGEVSA
jgi:hypothetical protein